LVYTVVFVDSSFVSVHMKVIKPFLQDMHTQYIFNTLL